MPIRRGVFAASITSLPTVTIGTTTGVTESRAVFNATVSANYQSTTVQFQYSKQSNFSTIEGTVTATGSPVTGQSVAVSYTVTGLTKATVVDAAAVTYYVRCVVTNSIGTATSSVTSFDLWTLRQIASNSTSSPFTVPTVAGVNPTALPVVVLVGGGGGGGFQGGGGGAGGLVVRYNYAFTGSSGYLYWTVGGGGGGGTSGSANGSAGTSSTLSGTNLTSVSAGGGGRGIFQGSGGNVGTGDNPAYTGGTVYVDSNGKVSIYYCGGGAGNEGNGGNGSNGAYGVGAAGNSFWGNSGGGGGGNDNTNTAGAHGSPNTVGAGGNGGTNDGSITPAQSGTAGRVVFQYYGP